MSNADVDGIFGEMKSDRLHVISPKVSSNVKTNTIFPFEKFGVLHHHVAYKLVILF